MRPPSLPASLLYHPLDEILGSRGNVGVLRILVEHGGPLPAAYVAQRSRLTVQGVRKVLDALVSLNVVDRIGLGREGLFELRSAHPLASPLRALFQAEAERADTWFREVRGRVETMDPRPVAVWLFGSAARREDTAASDFDLALVGSEPHLLEQADDLQESLEGPAERWLVRPSIITLTMDDVRRHRREDTPFWRNLVRDAVALHGPAPTAFGDGDGHP